MSDKTLPDKLHRVRWACSVPNCAKAHIHVWHAQFQCFLQNVWLCHALEGPCSMDDLSTGPSCDVGANQNSVGRATHQKQMPRMLCRKRTKRGTSWRVGSCPSELNVFFSCPVKIYVADMSPVRGIRRIQQQELVQTQNKIEGWSQWHPGTCWSSLRSLYFGTGQDTGKANANAVPVRVIASFAVSPTYANANQLL